jgi:hypothetical protein
MPLTRRELVQTASLGTVLASSLKATPADAARGGRSDPGYALIAVRTAVAELFSKLSNRLALPDGVPMPAQSLGIAACAVRRELIALLHTDTPPLVLSAAIGALVVVACISWPQVSRISLKTQTVERK